MLFSLPLREVLFWFCLWTFESPGFKNVTFESMSIWRNAQVDGLIVTITDDSNYGNIIQRYALKRVLELNGRIFNTTHIRPSFMPKDKMNVIFENTRAFVRKYVGGEDFNSSKLQGFRNYIVGSDQVWRDWYLGSWAKFSPFFFEFIDNGSLNKKANRISYAASFGVNKVDAAMNTNAQTRIRPLLKKFSGISVREESGQNIIKNTWGFESTVVLDPTFLLRASEYSKLVEDSASKNTGIGKLFYYVLDENKSKSDFALKISNTLGFRKTRFVPSRRKRFESVEKWLKGFRDAQFVITDSYHGMVFSIINNTDFVVIGNVRRGLTRFQSLLQALGLTGRLIDERFVTQVKLSELGAIDWKVVNRKLEPLRKKSLNWLLDNLK